jgi:hypothetical protein
MIRSITILGLWLELRPRVKIWIGIQLNKKYLCLNFFDNFNDDMVRTCDKHDASRFKNKDYAIDKEDHKLIVVTIINVSPLLW